MNLPFTVEQFLEVFRSYNLAIWPAQIVAYLVGLATVYGLIAKKPWGARFALATMCAMWSWVGVAYHILYFRQINPIAAVFGGLFILQGILFGISTALRQNSASPGPFAKATSIVVLLYSLIGYPALNIAFGNAYPAMPVFGVAPCPTVIFTLGILIWLDRSVAAAHLIIPALWSVIATSAALQLGMREDFGLPIAAALAIGCRYLLPKTAGLSQGIEDSRIG